MLPRERFKPRGRLPLAALRRAALYAALCAALALGISACGAGASRGSNPASIWTDVPELALYAELFNGAQSRYRVEVLWKADLEASLKAEGPKPALVVGRYLKSTAVRERFQDLSFLFGELTVNQAAFYPELLSTGTFGGRQLLLPLSFNLPAIVFPADPASADLAEVRGKALVGMQDFARASSSFNKKQGPAFVRMGFSPRWDADFLVLAVNAGGADFREGRPLAWQEEGLKAAIDSLKAWTKNVNGEPSLEEDFQFKYLYTPGYKYVADGRALFAYMDSSDFFLLPEEKRTSLDYRWFAERGSIPVDPEIVCAAIPLAGRDKAAAEAFLKWFFKEESQRAMLENARKTRALESSFGVAEGFSSLRSVTERLFPLYYPSLVGHLPPPEALASPEALPSAWPELKAKVLGPWLLEATAGAAGKPGVELSARLSDYVKKNGN
jgi:ABC-type glycerol-3-phosphate transport system substrate-binding protein